MSHDSRQYSDYHHSSLPQLKVCALWFTEVNITLLLSIFKYSAGNGLFQITAKHHTQETCLQYIEVLLVKLKALHSEYFLSDHLQCTVCYDTLYH